MSPSKTPRKVEGSNGLWQKSLQFFKQKMIKVLDFMVWVSQEQPAARSGQEKSQLQPGEPAASSQQCQEQPGGESGGEPGAARRATASSHQCQEQPGEPAASRSSQQAASSSYEQPK